jgi:DNA-binding CsgD family transcriptional regulator
MKQTSNPPTRNQETASLLTDVEVARQLKVSVSSLVLDISEHTVKTHLRRLYNKTGAETRAQLVVWRERRAA